MSLSVPDAASAWVTPTLLHHDKSVVFQMEQIEREDGEKEKVREIKVEEGRERGNLQLYCTLVIKFH
jgi:hypothetical protein